MSKKQEKIWQDLKIEDLLCYVGNLELPTGYAVPKMDVRWKICCWQLCQYPSLKRGYESKKFKGLSAK